MKPFKAFHALLTNPLFLRRRASESGRRAACFFLAWFVVALVVGAVAHTYYFLDSRQGFAYYASKALKGGRIIGGVLHPSGDTPSVPPAPFVRAAISKLMPGMPGFAENVSDSFVVIDTGRNVRDYHSTFVVLRDSGLAFVAPPLEGQSIPYEWLFGPNATVEIGHEELSRVLDRQWLAVGLFYLQWDALVLVYKTLAALPLLFLAAYILNFGRRTVPSVALKKGTYAFSIVLAGTALEAVAGTTMAEPWYLFMVIALFVVIRSNWRPVRKGQVAEKR